MQLYVINLERSVERFERICAQFSQFRLDFTRIKAIDAHDLSDEQYFAVQNANIWTQALTRGEIACFLSHAKALETFIADNVPYGVIFEDDVLLGQSAQKWLHTSKWLIKIMQQTGEEIDIVKLETSGKKLWLGQQWSIQQEGEEGFSLAKIKSTHIMAASYLISRQAAMRLLELMQQKAAPFDHFLFNFSLGNAQKFALYQLDPAIVVQTDLTSTLEGERSQNKQQVKSRRTVYQTLKRETRRVFRRAKQGIWVMKINFFTTEQWKRIPFRD